MAKLYSSKHIIKILYKKGFIFISQKGSHIKLRKINKQVLTVIVPANRSQIPQGTFSSILRQSNLSEEDFKK
jgi:predicted RNA binding protein YcfA (HicA-like mRNA interferase family)